jgi:hypothetical protein
METFMEYLDRKKREEGKDSPEPLPANEGISEPKHKKQFITDVTDKMYGPIEKVGMESEYEQEQAGLAKALSTKNGKERTPKARPLGSSIKEELNLIMEIKDPVVRKRMIEDLNQYYKLGKNKLVES